MSRYSKFAGGTGSYRPEEEGLVSAMGAIPVLSVILAISLCCVICMLSAPLEPRGRRALTEHATATAPSRADFQSTSSILQRCENGEDVSGTLVSFGGKVDHTYTDQVWLDSGVVVENLGGRTIYKGETLTGEGMVIGCSNGYLLVSANTREAE